MNTDIVCVCVSVWLYCYENAALCYVYTHFFLLLLILFSHVLSSTRHGYIVFLRIFFFLVLDLCSFYFSNFESSFQTECSDFFFSSSFRAFHLVCLIHSPTMQLFCHESVFIPLVKLMQSADWRLKVYWIVFLCI